MCFNHIYGVSSYDSPMHRHTGEENSGTSPIAHQNMEFSHIDINLEFGIGVGVVSYNSPIASPLYLSLYWECRYLFLLY